MEIRRQAYGKLCEAVYKEKGYSSEAIPLPETLEKFGLLDDQAIDLLAEYGFGFKRRLLSN